MLKKFMITAILMTSALAQASGGDCYMSGNCPGNPDQSNAAGSAFTSSASAALDVIAQVAQAMTPVPAESTFSATSPQLNTKTKAQETQTGYDDGVEQ